jgi:hypothetical protein
VCGCAAATAHTRWHMTYALVEGANCQSTANQFSSILKSEIDRSRRGVDWLGIFKRRHRASHHSPPPPLNQYGLYLSHQLLSEPKLVLNQGTYRGISPRYPPAAEAVLWGGGGERKLKTRPRASSIPHPGWEVLGGPGGPGDRQPANELNEVRAGAGSSLETVDF